MYVKKTVRVNGVVKIIIAGTQEQISAKLSVVAVCVKVGLTVS